ncbi:hypothetical protein RRG08_019942 [Elysia crispata]|uniref:Uncharacterized protein n=1 Tax=Elysia crispata TaxID=231223 RepID=A0AAE0Y0C2_9GAST|nr:hypothetical protein RRG08_019942 [Elysia crispata]
MALTQLRRYLSLVSCLVIVSITPRPVLAATRCYDKLGCYESLTLHALPQEPAHLRTEFHVSCRGHTDDTVVRATDTPRRLGKIRLVS